MRFLKRLESKVRIVLDGADATSLRYHVSGFPTAVAVDGDQKIRGYGHPKDAEELKQLLVRSPAKSVSEAGSKQGLTLPLLSSSKPG